jgi:hypothetical protein
MSAALFVLNPRHIPACIEAIEALDIPTCWISYMDEERAANAINEQIRLHSFDSYVILSDDCIPTQEALDKVLDVASGYHYLDGATLHKDAVVTGYCNLDEGMYLDVVNLTVNTLPPPPSQQNSYHLMTRKQVESGPDNRVIPTTFAGLSLTCASREIWLKHPLQVDPITKGQMDYDLCYRLAQSGIPIYAAKGAYVHHVKERWCFMDQNPEKRLLIGEKQPQVRWTKLPRPDPQPVYG